MKVLGLDVSTKTGYAVINDGVLAEHGLVRTEPVMLSELEEDFCLLERATRMADTVFGLITMHNPDLICIEQTNAGRFRDAQKQLEFIHCVLLNRISGDNGEMWKHLPKITRYVDTSKWRSVLEVKLSKDQRKHNKQVKLKAARGKVTSKHLAVAWVNEKYELKLKLKDNDIADAICLATFGYLRRPTVSVPQFDLDTIVLNP